MLVVFKPDFLRFVSAPSWPVCGGGVGGGGGGGTL